MLDTLESRRLFSATVTEGYPGFFEIDGTSDADEIYVAVSQANHTFTLDGNTYAGVANIVIHAGSGDDAINVTSLDGPDGDIAAGIDAGSGDDSIMLNFAGSVYCGPGNDFLYMGDANRGEAYGGPGDDTIFIYGATDHAEIQGNQGNDYIDCCQNMYSVVLHGGGGDDTLAGSDQDDQIYGDDGTDSLIGNGGNDEFYTRYGSGSMVDGGSGIDILYANGSESDVGGVEYIYYV
jgi:Ca2+-binding RTX toxin-like protein